VRTDRPDMPDADDGLADQRLDPVDPPDTDDPQRDPDNPRPGSTEDMRGRLKDLPDGHPSSPYNDDGSPKPPVLRLQDLDLPETDEDSRQSSDRPPPLTDAEHAEHVQEVRGLLDKARADGLETDQQYTIDQEKEQWKPDRNRAQRELVNDLFGQAYEVPNERRAILAGGLGGAGKSTVLEQYAGIDRSQYLTINPDAIKEEMARRGMIPDVEGLSPMEASELAHEESSMIAKRLALRAEAGGKNILWDITMSTQSSTELRIDNLRSSGYTEIEGIFVDIPVETSIARADARHRIGHDDYRAGNGLGGRFVPPEVIQRQADPEWGSVNRRTFEEVKDKLDGWSLYDNSVDGGAPVLTDAGYKEEKRYDQRGH
jgi:predicted ABC-type ATPase